MYAWDEFQGQTQCLLNDYMIENTTNFWQQNIASTIAHSRYLMSQIFDGGWDHWTN